MLSAHSYIADTYLGRFNTICYAVVVALVGHALLVASAAPSIIKHPNGAIGLFAVAIVIMGVGTGEFFKPLSLGPSPFWVSLGCTGRS